MSFKELEEAIRNHPRYGTLIHYGRLIQRESLIVALKKCEASFREIEACFDAFKKQLQDFPKLLPKEKGMLRVSRAWGYYQRIQVWKEKVLEGDTKL